MEKITFKRYVQTRLKDKFSSVVFASYLLFCFTSAVYWCFDLQVRNFLMSLFFAAFVPLIFIAEYRLGIYCGKLFTIGVLFLAVGAILGTCFNLYTLLPFFDTLLHGTSGVLFGGLGFTLAEKFFGEACAKKTFFGCLIFAVCFSLAIAAVWEIFEYTCTSLFGFDMAEDTFVTDIRSYFLSGSHTETVDIEGITQTIIHYGNGQTYIMDGYLDLGWIDTLTDMMICTAGAFVFTGTAIVGYVKYPKINATLLPKSKNPILRKENEK